MIKYFNPTPHERMEKRLAQINQEILDYELIQRDYAGKLSALRSQRRYLETALDAGQSPSAKARLTVVRQK